MDAAADNNEFLLRPFQRLDVFPCSAHFTMRRGCEPSASSFANNIGYFGPYEGKFRPVEADATHWGGCSGGRNSLGIDNGVFELTLQDRHGNAPIAINLPGQARSPARIAAARP